MISQKKLLLLALLVIGVVLLQPVLAAETASTSMYTSPTTITWQIISGTASPTGGMAPLTVQFKDTSRIWSMYCQWNFGDGTYSNGNPHTVSHTYSKAGTYSVSLTIQDSNYKYITSQVATIKVNSPTPLVITNITAAINCPMVSFTGTSTGNPTSWSWNFGDGKTSAEQNPAHTYSANGDYLVTLSTTSLSGSNSVSKQVSVGCVIPLSINPIPQGATGDPIHTSGNAGGYPDGTNLTITFQTDFSSTGVWKQWYPYVNVKNGVWSYTEISTSDWVPGNWTATISDSSSNSRSTSFFFNPKVSFRWTTINPIPDAVPGDAIHTSGSAVGYPDNAPLTVTYQTDFSSTGFWKYWNSSILVKNEVWSHDVLSTSGWVPGKWTATINDSSGSSTSTSFNIQPKVVPVSNITITTWTKDGEYTVAGAKVYLGGKNGQILGTTGIDGSLTVSVPYDTPSLYAKSPVYKDSYFYEGSWILYRILLIPSPPPSPTPSPISINLDQRVDHFDFTEVNNNALVSMKKGSALSLKLSENPTTGYQWVLSTSPGLKVNQDSYIGSDKGCCGYGGTRIWEMTTDSTGQQKILAVYKHPWDPITGQETTFQMTINVK